MQDTGANPVLQAAASEHVPVLMPLPPGALSESDYSDAFHLNSSEAVKFTGSLVGGLQNVIRHPGTGTNNDGAITVPDAVRGRPRITSAVPAATTVDAMH